MDSTRAANMGKFTNQHGGCGILHLIGGLELFFPYIGNNHPNWLIFFRGVETTNQDISTVNHRWSSYKLSFRKGGPHFKYRIQGFNISTNIQLWNKAWNIIFGNPRFYLLQDD
jgi:hypothetical protein